MLSRITDSSFFKKKFVFVILFLDPDCCDSGNTGDDLKNDLCFLFASLPSSVAILCICVDDEVCCSSLPSRVDQSPRVQLAGSFLLWMSPRQLLLNDQAQQWEQGLPFSGSLHQISQLVW